MSLEVYDEFFGGSFLCLVLDCFLRRLSHSHLRSVPPLTCCLQNLMISFEVCVGVQSNEEGAQHAALWCASAEGQTKFGLSLSVCGKLGSY